MPVLRDMGKWNKENNNDTGNKKYYQNIDAVEKVIRYITRTRWNETRQADLIKVGGAGIDVNAPVDIIIQQFLAVQNFNHINERGGRRLIHEVFSFRDEEFNMLNNDYTFIDLIARQISAYFFNQGFQVVYAIHYEPDKKVHIHLVVNSINFITGKKLLSKGEDFKYRLKVFNSIFDNMCQIVKNELSL